LSSIILSFMIMTIPARQRNAGLTFSLSRRGCPEKND